MTKIKLRMKMPVIIFYCVFISLFVLNSVAHAEPIKIRFAHVVSENTPKGQMAIRFQTLVKKRLGDDKVVVEIFPNSTLFNDSQVIDEILKNNVEMAAPSMSKMKKYAPRLQVMDLPFIFVTPEAANNFLKGEYGERLLRLVRRQGLLGLGFLNNGMKQLSTRLPSKVPVDIEGMKFRIINSDVLKSQFTQVNAIPESHSFSKVYGLLKDEKIDGQENTWSNIYSKKFYEFQPSIIESNHGYLGYMLLTNQTFWDGLPEDVRKILDESLIEAITYGNEIALEKSVLDKARIIETGLSNVHVLTVEERKLWVNAMRPVWSKFENEIGSELILAAASSR